jgi:UDP-N-acetylglucosamine 2-epimerase (non-hydrolysing)
LTRLLRHREMAARSPLLDGLGMRQIGIRQNGAGCRAYGVLTLHRPSNVYDPETLQGILSAVSSLAAQFPVFFPMHPRTRKNIESFGLLRYLANSEGRNDGGIVPLDPLGYLDSLSLNDRARIVLTDSGGVQEETTVLGVPCLTLRQNTERPATVEHPFESGCGSGSRSHSKNCSGDPSGTGRHAAMSSALGWQSGCEDRGDPPRASSARKSRLEQ